jgi:hypothetical protein
MVEKKHSFPAHLYSDNQLQNNTFTSPNLSRKFKLFKSSTQHQRRNIEHIDIVMRTRHHSHTCFAHSTCRYGECKHVTCLVTYSSKGLLIDRIEAKYNSWLSLRCEVAGACRQSVLIYIFIRIVYLNPMKAAMSYYNYNSLCSGDYSCIVDISRT